MVTFLPKTTLYLFTWLDENVLDKTLDVIFGVVSNPK